MDTNRLPKQALQYKPKGRRNIGRPRKRWRDQLHLEDQGTGNTPNPSGTWWWWLLLFSFFLTYFFSPVRSECLCFGGLIWLFSNFICKSHVVTFWSHFPFIYIYIWTYKLFKTNIYIWVHGCNFIIATINIVLI